MKDLDPMEDGWAGGVVMCMEEEERSMQEVCRDEGGQRGAEVRGGEDS